MQKKDFLRIYFTYCGIRTFSLYLIKLFFFLCIFGLLHISHRFKCPNIFQAPKANKYANKQADILMKRPVGGPSSPLA